MAPDLNIIKLYTLYTEQVTNPVSSFVFRKIFNEEFNLIYLSIHSYQILVENVIHTLLKLK